MMFRHVFLLFHFFLFSQWQMITSNRTFPDYFKFGIATASYQVEGGWNEDGKGENIWDNICHKNPTFVNNSHNGDIACDSYHKYKEDVALLKQLGVDFYRFSLSWSRIIPLGLANSPINQAGLDYYRKLLQELVDNDIEPMVTLFHWDTPQTLQDYGGFPNPEMEEHFVYYARIVFENFGDLVKLWSTFNEPLQTCHEGYGLGILAPGIVSSGLAEYKCAHTLIKAHARVYHMYDQEFRKQQKGTIGIIADTAWYEPASTSPSDLEASERALQFTFGWYINPIVHGNYPSVMINRIDTRSQEQSFKSSRLPKFTDQEIEYIKGTYDYIAINPYTTLYAATTDESTNLTLVSYDDDRNVKSYFDETWEKSASAWLRVVPWGLRKLLNWMSKTYNDPEIWITENGFSDLGGLNDKGRIDYHKTHLSNILDAIIEDGVNVTRYTVWSLMDNFEWTRGYREKFGLYSVDFNDPNRPRKAKASAAFYAKVIATRCLDNNCE